MESEMQTPEVQETAPSVEASAEPAEAPADKAGSLVDSLRQTVADSLSFLGPTWDKVRAFFAEQRKTITGVVLISLAVLVLVLVSGVLGIINAIPFLPAVLEILGLWFAARYLVMAESRRAVVQEFSEFIGKITGQS
ncbi:CAAD domain-containing protein [Gloeomargaritales cyanobacterium VI4D9]|nr:CAAD domain-containing protein [Gloeomargaritales cyanobacterium VI4D9]